MSKKCLITKLKDTVNNTDIIFGGLNDIIIKASKDVNVSLSIFLTFVNNGGESYVEPLHGSTWYDGTVDRRTELYDINTNKNMITNISLKKDNLYRYHFDDINRCYNFVMCGSFNDDVSYHNLFRLNLDTIRLLKFVHKKEIYIDEILSISQKFHTIEINETEYLTGDINSLVDYFYNISNDYKRLNFSETKKLSGDILHISKLFDGSINITYSMTTLLRNTNVSGSIESLVQKIRSYGVYLNSTNLPNSGVTLTLSGTQCTWNGIPAPYLNEGDSKSLLSWTEDTITYNNETINA